MWITARFSLTSLLFVLTSQLAVAGTGDVDLSFGINLGAGGGQAAISFDAYDSTGTRKTDRAIAVFREPTAGRSYRLYGSAEKYVSSTSTERRLLGTAIAHDAFSGDLGISGAIGFPVAATRDRYGRVYVVGLGKVGTISEFCLTRFLADGSADNTFGTNDVLCLYYTDMNNVGQNTEPLDVAVDSNNRIIVVSAVIDPSNVNNPSVELARLSGTGVIDSTFSLHGPQSTLPNYNAYGMRLAIGSDDRIVLAGYTETSNFSTATSVVLALKADGTPLIAPKYFTDPGNTINAVAVDAQNRILIAGTQTSPVYSGYVQRLLADGNYDNSFGPPPPDRFAITGTKAINSLAICPETACTQGSILLGGSGSDGQMIAASVTKDGALNPAFYPGGANPTTITFLDANNLPAAGAALSAIFDASQPVLAGYYHKADPYNDDFAMVRLQSDRIFADRFGP